LCFFFHHTPPTQIYTLSLHDALPISHSSDMFRRKSRPVCINVTKSSRSRSGGMLVQPSHTFPKKSWLRPWHSQTPARQTAEEMRSEEHTSELQSLRHLVCRLLLEKKK